MYNELAIKSEMLSPGILALCFQNRHSKLLFTIKTLKIRFDFITTHLSLSMFSANCHDILTSADKCSDATTAEKLRETKVWAPTPGRLHPAPGQRLGWALGAGGVAPPTVRVRVSPRKIFENLHAKSCILVTTCCEISCFLKTTDKKLQGHCWPPNLKVGDQSPPVPTVVAPMENVLKLAWP